MEFLVADDIFEFHPELIAHPVNCQGLCRDSLSRQLKKAWPDYFREYTRNCLRKKLEPGNALLVDLGTMLSTRFIVTLTVRNHWNDALQPPVVKPAVHKLLELAHTRGVTSVAIPFLHGTPEGWLKAQFENYFSQLIVSSLERVYFFNGE